MTGDDSALIFEGASAELAFRAFGVEGQRGDRGKLVSIGFVKPADVERIRRLAAAVGGIVTVENRSVVGGLGRPVDEIVCNTPRHASVLCVGVPDAFTESGPSAAVNAKHGLIMENVLEKLGL